MSKTKQKISIEEKTKKMLEPTNDYVFTRIFGYKGNEKITQDFIQAITGEIYDNIELKETTMLNRDLMNDKLGILDVKAVNVDVQVDIEMQVTNYANIVERLLFYWAKKREDYKKAKKTIIILVVKFRLNELEKLKEYHSKWRIIEDKYRKIILTDKLEFHIIELGKIKEGIYTEEDGKLKEWCEFLISPKGGSEYMGKNKEIKKAMEVLEDISQDERERRLADLREKYILEKMDAEETGYMRGMKQGIEQGERQMEIEKRKIVKKLKEKGMEIKEIIDITGLTKEEIEKI